MDKKYRKASFREGALSSEKEKDDKKKASIYQENGYTSREDYFRNLADDFDIDLDTVQMLARVLGPEEDFDGLVAALKDATE